MRTIRKRGILVFVLIILTLLAYYQIDYKRHFIQNREKTECITIWQRVGNNCYIIPEKYIGIFSPKTNYIKTVNYRNFIGIIWNTSDNVDFKISLYNDYQIIDWKSNAIVCKNNDSLLLEYRILDTLDIQRGKRIINDSAEYFKNKADYNYIDLNRIIGIKTYKY